MFENYEKYLAFVNKKITGFFDKQKEYIKCEKGCAKCCKNAEFPFTLMEFKYLLSGFLCLDKETQNIIENNISKVIEEKKNFKGDKFLYNCPFLINNACSVYSYRGIVCRTFGLLTLSDDSKPTKVPFCIYDGLNYSMVLDKETDMISAEDYKERGFTNPPLGFNIKYDFLTSDLFENEFNFKFGEKKPLIDWFQTARQKN